MNNSDFIVETDPIQGTRIPISDGKALNGKKRSSSFSYGRGFSEGGPGIPGGTGKGNRPGVLILLIGFAAVLGLGLASGRESLPSIPPNLGETGLYSNYALKTIDSRNLLYSPQYALWSDGASKRRWIYLPPGTSIDASDPDVWAFPVGTKVWKEFSFQGRKVETRLIEKIGAEEWRFASYIWNENESDAILAPFHGYRGVAEIQPGLRHDIPGMPDCKACHVNARTEILGFSALQLSSDRDPNAPHAEGFVPGMVNLEILIDRGLIRSYPPEWRNRPLRIDAARPTARAVLGYLHSNCGNCHNPSGSLDTLNLLLRHSVAPSAHDEFALKTAVDKKGRFQIPGTAPGETYLIRPGDPEHSSVVYRLSTRNPFRQMPALGTKLADANAVDLIRRWIQEDLVKREPPTATGNEKQRH
jgi:hypothetical protein